MARSIAVAELPLLSRWLETQVPGSLKLHGEVLGALSGRDTLGGAGEDIIMAPSGWAALEEADAGGGALAEVSAAVSRRHYCPGNAQLLLSFFATDASAAVRTPVAQPLLPCLTHGACAGRAERGGAGSAGAPRAVDHARRPGRQMASGGSGGLWRWRLGPRRWRGRRILALGGAGRADVAAARCRGSLRCRAASGRSAAGLHAGPRGAGRFEAGQRNVGIRESLQASPA